MTRISTPAFSYQVTSGRTQSFIVKAEDQGVTKDVSFDISMNQGTPTGSNTISRERFQIDKVVVPPGELAVTAGTNQAVGTLRYIYTSPGGGVAVQVVWNVVSKIDVPAEFS